MVDFFGNELIVGDRVVMTFVAGKLITATVAKISPSGGKCKVKPDHYGPNDTYSRKWKDRYCMVKI